MVRVEEGAIVAARILLDGTTRAGSVIAARLVSKGAGGRNAIARDDAGSEYLLPRGAGAITEGAALRIEITRERIPGKEPWKRALAKLSDHPISDAPVPAAEELAFPAPVDRLDRVGWNDLIEEARSGTVRFAGGELAIETTRAMTLIDVDGPGQPDALAVDGAAAAARAILRLDLQGSIGIDLPTTTGRAARHRAAEAVDAILTQPFERTAVNGFGFLQIVRPRRGPSLVELARDRVPFEARALLRQAAFGQGACALTVHPAIAAALDDRPDWIATLCRQRGGAIGLRPDPSLTISGWHVDQA